MGYVDLHAHFLPGIDDGCRDLDSGLELARGLCSLGFTTLVATPHIRTSMWDNRRPGIAAATDAFRTALGEGNGAPEITFAAEHFFDDVFWRLMESGDAVAYAGGKTILVELPAAVLPHDVDRRFFEMRVRGLRPVLAHPERYAAAWSDIAKLEPAHRCGAIFLVDLGSLVGKYGGKAKRAAEQMIEAGMVTTLCSDAHRPKDVAKVGRGIERLQKLVGASTADRMLDGAARAVLEGTERTT